MAGSAPPEMSLIATAPASSALRATSGWKVSAVTGASRRAASPSTPGTSPGAGSDVDQVEPGLGLGQAVLHGALGRLVARPLEERIGAHVDDPHRQRGRELEHAVGEAPARHRRPKLVVSVVTSVPDWRRPSISSAAGPAGACSVRGRGPALR